MDIAFRHSWISTQNSVDMDMDIDRKFNLHGKPARCIRNYLRGCVSGFI